MTLPSSIFYSYDIRGKYGEDLTDNIALYVGKALGTFVACHIESHTSPSVCVGRDSRPSGKNLTESFIKGLLSTRCDVVDLGIATTPIVNFSEYTLKVSAGISVTASHNDKEYNGFKISFNKKPFSQKDYQELRKIVEIGKFEKGEGRVESKDITREYLNNIYNSIKVDRNKVERLSKELHISQDQDGDRLIVKDVKPDLINAILAASILEKNRTAIVLNIAASLSVIEYIKKHGGHVILSKTGYPNIMEMMDKNNALFGGEISGHYFFKDKHFGYSDGLYSAARLCEVLITKEVSLSQLIKQIPQYPSTPEIRVELPGNKNAHTVVKELIREAHIAFPNADFLEIDGVRITLHDKSWFLIRASGTENVISTRVEAKTKKDLEELTKKLRRVFLKGKVKLTL